MKNFKFLFLNSKIFVRFEKFVVSLLSYLILFLITFETVELFYNVFVYVGRNRWQRIVFEEKKKIKIEKQFNFLPMAKETIKWLFLMIHAR